MQYHTLVEYLRMPLARFFAASLAIHLTFLLLWPKPAIRSVPQETISVSFLPAPQEPKAPEPKQAVKVPRQVPTRPSRSPAIIARKNSPELKTVTPKAVTPPGQTNALSESNEAKGIKPAPAPVKEPSLPAKDSSVPAKGPTPRREPVEEPQSITERRLPTVKELLPSANWSSARTTQREGPVRLDTKDPQYITYFNSIKRDIELVWQYPELALRYGLQGKLLLEFAISASGELESARIIRSSGSNVLDHEALRAIKAAAPFSPIPPWIDKNRIAIVASFEYLDNRLNYRVVP